MVEDQYTAQYSGGRHGTMAEDIPVLEEAGIDFEVKDAEDIEHGSIRIGAALVFPDFENASKAADYVIVAEHHDNGSKSMVEGERSLKPWA